MVILQKKFHRLLYTQYHRSSTIISPDILFTSFNSQLPIKITLQTLLQNFYSHVPHGT